MGQMKTQMLYAMYSRWLIIFTAEAKAVDLALELIRTCDINNKFIIFSYSVSVLKAMNHTKLIHRFKNF